MKVFGLILLFLLNLFAAQDYQKLLDSISEHAIQIGNGPNRIYAFVDPLCSKSRSFIDLINERKDLQKSTSYYIFLYRLPKFDSDEYIQYIYQSSKTLDALKTIMIYEDYDEMDDFKVSQETLDKTDKIAKVAKELKMKRRPYLLIYQQGSSYCTVSEGTAPCMEENGFD
jgi:hypothetical protein